MEKELYVCNPEKNTLCPKYGCQDFCFHTTSKEYSTDGKPVDPKECGADLKPVDPETGNKVKCELIHDNFQNIARYNVPRAQLVIADIPYNLGDKFYASRVDWYVDGDNKNGENKAKAHKAAFHTDYRFNLAEFLHYASRMLKKEPGKGEKDAPCLIVFCAFEQMFELMEIAYKEGFKHHISLTFTKNFSPQVLKSNMRIVGATEYALVLYKDKLPKFRNYSEEYGKKHMIFDWFEYRKDNKDIPKIHPTQKPVNLLMKLISIFTDPGDVVIDPCAGSGSTLRAARELGRNSYGFESNGEFYNKAVEQMLAS